MTNEEPIKLSEFVKFKNWDLSKVERAFYGNLGHLGSFCQLTNSTFSFRINQYLTVTLTCFGYIPLTYNCA